MNKMKALLKIRQSIERTNAMIMEHLCYDRFDPQSANNNNNLNHGFQYDNDSYFHNDYNDNNENESINNNNNNNYNENNEKEKKNLNNNNNIHNFDKNDDTNNDILDDINSNNINNINNKQNDIYNILHYSQLEYNSNIDRLGYYSMLICHRAFENS